MYLLPGDAEKEKSKMTPIASSKKAQEKKIVLIPVADPGFPPRWGRLTPKVAIIWPIFPPKLHEIERIWTPLGARPWRPP